MRFASPLYLLLLLPIALLLWLELKKRTGAVIFSDTSFFAGYKKRSDILKYLLLALNILALVFMTLALARPQRGRVYEEVEVKGVDIMLCLDVSETMQYRDFSPDRITAAKECAKDFIERRPGDRFGLVIFGISSMVQCPLTSNKILLRDVIDRIKIGVIYPRTAIGLGLTSSINRIKDSKARDKVIILLTDGVNNAGDIDPITAAKLAQSYGIKVYCIGVGSTEPVTVMVNTPFGPQPQQVNYELDMKTLDEVAAITGGQSFLATDAEGLKVIYKEIDKMEPTTYKVNRHTVYSEKAYLFLFPALFLMLLGMALSLTVARRLP
ncbi:MAG: VWA domain-containing protein [Deltaproteobacteria bacterium]|nr:VWA domain-containing protein [Deltaproteobacteria bacterium]